MINSPSYSKDNKKSMIAVVEERMGNSGGDRRVNKGGDGASSSCSDL